MMGTNVRQTPEFWADPDLDLYEERICDFGEFKAARRAYCEKWLNDTQIRLIRNLLTSTRSG